MKIFILGATGSVGSSLLSEAIARGHTVTAGARSVGSLTEHHAVRAQVIDAANYARLPSFLAGHEAVISAVPFLNFEGEPLIRAVKNAQVGRLLVVGGAGSLEIAPGKFLVDAPDFPAEYKSEALAGRGFLSALRADTDLDWTFVSPPAFLHDGPRTGKFRLGKEVLLIDSGGQSHVSISDFAIAFLDELERPLHRRARFTVGY